MPENSGGLSSLPEHDTPSIGVKERPETSIPEPIAADHVLPGRKEGVPDKPGPISQVRHPPAISHGLDHTGVGPPGLPFHEPESPTRMIKIPEDRLGNGGLEIGTGRPQSGAARGLPTQLMKE